MLRFVFTLTLIFAISFVSTLGAAEKADSARKKPAFSVSLVPRTDSRGGVLCYITDFNGTVVTNVSLSSYFGNDDEIVYYLWFSPSFFATTEKMSLKFNSQGFGLSKQIQKLDYVIDSSVFIAIGFSITPEVLGPAIYKVKTDFEKCTTFFNVIQ